MAEGHVSSCWPYLFPSTCQYRQSIAAQGLLLTSLLLAVEGPPSSLHAHPLLQQHQDHLIASGAGKFLILDYVMR